MSSWGRPFRAGRPGYKLAVSRVRRWLRHFFYGWFGE